MGTFYSTLIEHQLHAGYCTEQHKSITVTCIAGRTLRGESIRSSHVPTPWAMAVTVTPIWQKPEKSRWAEAEQEQLFAGSRGLFVSWCVCVCLGQREEYNWYISHWNLKTFILGSAKQLFLAHKRGAYGSERSFNMLPEACNSWPSQKWYLECLVSKTADQSRWWSCQNLQI